MDLNGDGQNDILSGSYSHMDSDRPMLGEFYVLLGSEKGFAKPTVVNGRDGNPLAIPFDEDNEGETITRAICTRPAAVDLNGDGKLDIVAGNFEGTFWMFQGTGNGGFASTPTQVMAGEGAMVVDAHSDPFFVDWDGDQDLDLISGSSSGGVSLFVNQGSKTHPKFAARQEVFAPVVQKDSGIVVGSAHIDGPQGSTRVWADDVNGDGKLDLLIGDSLSIHQPAEGLTEAEMSKQLAAQDEAMEAAMHLDADARDLAMQKIWTARDKIVRSVATGFVWVAYGKSETKHPPK